MEKIVTNCKDCVFNTTNRDDEPYCKLDEENRNLITTDPNGYYVGDEIPEWCPILNEDVLIKLNKG